jgi:hypothetical protein
MINQTLSASVALFICMLISPMTQALDLNAGDYDPAPVGTTIGNLYWQNGLYNSYVNGSTSLPGRNREHAQVGIVSLQHYVDIGGYLAVPIVIQTFGQASSTVLGNSLGKDKGLGDLLLGLPFWVVNDAKTQTYFAIAPFLFLPTGSYDRKNAVNLGHNRYSGTLQLAFSTHLSPNIAWDIAADTTIHGDNRDAVGGGTLSQKPAYQLQTNTRYYLSPAVDLRAGVSYTDAGATKQNGVTTDANTVSRYWLGTGFWVSHSTQVSATYGRDIAVKNGFKNDNQINFRLIQIF